MEKVRNGAAAYYLIQGLAIAGWWGLLLTYPESQDWFALESDSLATLWAFWLPDLLLIGPGSFAVALAVKGHFRYAEHLAWLVTGGVAYATMYTAAMALMTDRGWLGVVLMLPAMLWSGVFATGLAVGGEMFRRAKPSSEAYVLTKTFGQIVVVWSVILLIFPYLITILEDKIGVVRWNFPGQAVTGAVLFVLLSIPGVWSAIVMSRKGKGTPLPLDHATSLVVSGPYAYVRNPMAVSGIGQGLAVAFILGSPLVAVYALMGSAIWQFVFRPLEEDDLAARFGDPYNVYRRAVRCWIPKLRPFPAAGSGISEKE